MSAQRHLHMDDRYREVDAQIDRMLDAAEDLMRDCIKRGAGDALRRRAERLLNIAAAPAPSAAPFLDAMRLTRILVQLRRVTKLRLTADEHEANRLARGDVMAALDQLGVAA